MRTAKTSKHPRKAYRPRWAPTADTLALALHRAAKPAQADVNEVLQAMKAAARALCGGAATEMQWSIMAGSLDVANAIEKRGIVRGLAEHLQAADTALQAAYNRAMVSGNGAHPTWRAPALHSYEIEAIRTFADLHAFQCRQLGRAEFLQAIDAAAAHVRSTGACVTLANSQDIERLAA